MLSTVLLLISGIAWTVVYVTAIRIGFRDKTYCMPVWALGLNICWEFIYAIEGIPHPTLQTGANAAWACCDVLIVITYLRFGAKWSPVGKGRFGLYSAAVFATCLVAQLAFFVHFDTVREAAQYSAFAQNAVMSVLFVMMLVRRDSCEGQSMVIAVAKMLGTLAPTIQQGLVWGFNGYILMMGAICLAWDLAYIVLLHRKQLEEH